MAKSGDDRGRGAPLARRDEGAYCLYVAEEQRSQHGCLGGERDRLGQSRSLRRPGVKFTGSGALLLLLLGSKVSLAEPTSAPPGTAVASSSSDFSAATSVVVISDEPGDAVSARLTRDLRSLGFSVMVLQATPENSSDAAALERSARALGGIAAIHVWSGARGSELFLIEPSTQQSLARTLASSASANTHPSEVALGTLELLRASLLELHSSIPRPTPAPPSKAEPLPSSGPNPKLERGNFSMSGALAAELGLRSIGPSLSSMWSAWFRFRGCLGGRVFLALPILPEKGEVAGGRVVVEPQILGAGLSCNLDSNGARLWPRGSLGVAAARVLTRGTATDPARSHEETTWLSGGFAMLGLGLHLTQAVRLNLDATCVVLPTPAIVLAEGRQVARWGAPGALLSLGVEVLALP